MPFVHHRASLVGLVALSAAVSAAACDRSGARSASSADSSAPSAASGRVTASSPSPRIIRRIIRDDFGDSLLVGVPPTRIVSLNPATTELFFALGAGNRLVGRTHYDLYPAAALAVPDLGNGMRPNVEAVLGARPDLVVLYASNDNRDAAARFRAAGVQTLTLRVDRHRALSACRDHARSGARRLGHGARGRGLG